MKFTIHKTSGIDCWECRYQGMLIAWHKSKHEAVKKMHKVLRKWCVYRLKQGE